MKALNLAIAALIENNIRGGRISTDQLLENLGSRAKAYLANRSNMHEMNRLSPRLKQDVGLMDMGKDIKPDFYAHQQAPNHTTCLTC